MLRGFFKKPTVTRTVHSSKRSMPHPTPAPLEQKLPGEIIRARKTARAAAQKTREAAIEAQNANDPVIKDWDARFGTGNENEPRTPSKKNAPRKAGFFGKKGWFGASEEQKRIQEATAVADADIALRGEAMSMEVKERPSFPGAPADPERPLSLTDRAQGQLPFSDSDFETVRSEYPGFRSFDVGARAMKAGTYEQLIRERAPQGVDAITGEKYAFLEDDYQLNDVLRKENAYVRFAQERAVQPDPYPGVENPHQVAAGDFETYWRESEAKLPPELKKRIEKYNSRFGISDRNHKMARIIENIRNEDINYINTGKANRDLLTPIRENPPSRTPFRKRLEGRGPEGRDTPAPGPGMQHYTQAGFAADFQESSAFIDKLEDAARQSGLSAGDVYQQSGTEMRLRGRVFQKTRRFWGNGRYDNEGLLREGQIDINEGAWAKRSSGAEFPSRGPMSAMTVTTEIMERAKREGRNSMRAVRLMKALGGKFMRLAVKAKQANPKYKTAAGAALLTAASYATYMAVDDATQSEDALMSIETANAMRGDDDANTASDAPTSDTQTPSDRAAKLRSILDTLNPLPKKLQKKFESPAERASPDDPAGQLLDNAIDVAGGYLDPIGVSVLNPNSIHYKTTASKTNEAEYDFADEPSPRNINLEEIFFRALQQMEVENDVGLGVDYEYETGARLQGSVWNIPFPNQPWNEHSYIIRNNEAPIPVVGLSKQDLVERKAAMRNNRVFMKGDPILSERLNDPRARVLKTAIPVDTGVETYDGGDPNAYYPTGFQPRQMWEDVARKTPAFSDPEKEARAEYTTAGRQWRGDRGTEVSIAYDYDTTHVVGVPGNMNPTTARGGGNLETTTGAPLTSAPNIVELYPSEDTYDNIMRKSETTRTEVQGNSPNEETGVPKPPQGSESVPPATGTSTKRKAPSLNAANQGNSRLRYSYEQALPENTKKRQRDLQSGRQGIPGAIGTS